MIYVTAATSGPSLKLLKGCLWLLLPWSMRGPSFLAPLRRRCGWLSFCGAVIAAAMASLLAKLAVGLRGAVNVSERCAIA